MMIIDLSFWIKFLRKRKTSQKLKTKKDKKFGRQMKKLLDQGFTRYGELTDNFSPFTSKELKANEE